MCTENSKKGLFYFRFEKGKTLTAQVSSMDLWHYRVGHPSMRVMKDIVADLAIKNLGSDFKFYKCCPLGKLKQLPFNNIVISSKGILEILHIDIWGPTPNKLL